MRREDRRQWRRILLLVCTRAKEVTIDKTLDVWMQVRLRLFDDEESVVTFTVRYEPIEFETLQRHEDQIGCAETGVGNPTRAIVDQEAQAAQQGVDPRRRKTEGQRNRMLLARDGDQPLADPLCRGDHFGMALQIGLRLVHLLLYFGASILVQGG